MEEESQEEERTNQMLPWLFHSKLAEVDEKHPTRCVTAAVHWLLCKAAFKTNISQSKVAKKFLVQPKKLHIAIMGQKYDTGQKLTKKEKVERAAATSTTPSKPKVAKQDTMKNPKDQPMEADSAKAVDTPDPIDIDSDDDLWDPFSDQQKRFGGDVDDDVLMQPGSDTEKKVFKTKKPTAAK